jgi:O-antigen ligase
MNIKWRTYLTYEQLTYLLLFLFPIAGMLVPGWITNIYNLLFLVGLFYLRRRKQPLCKEDRIFLLICAIYVAIFFLSALVNGWEPIQTHRLGTELRFWMVIPIYLLVREQKDAWRWYLFGGLLGIVFIFTQSYYEVHWEHLSTAWGAYSKNIIGPFAALLGFYALYLWRSQASAFLKTAIVLCFLLAMLATAMSGSRGAYIGFIAMTITWSLFTMRKRWMVTFLLLAAVLAGVIYNHSVIVKSGVNRALNSFVVYFHTPDIVHADISDDSTEIHMEMWRAARYFFPDHPIFGVGPGNYHATAEKYAAEGKVNPAIAMHTHPHNIFLEDLYSKGIIGFISILLLLYYPFYILYKTRRRSPMSASLGMVHIIGISAFSLFDHSPITKNNYSSILLLGIALFFSHHLNRIQERESEHA